MDYQTFIKILYISTAIGAFTDIFDTSIVGGTSASIITSLKLTTPEFGLLGSMTFVGGIFGALSFGFLTDKLGRKRSFLLTLSLFVIFELLSGLAPNYLSLLLFRTIVGFAIGADYVPAITLLAEFVKPKVRGSSFDFFWIIANIGALASYLIAFSLIPFGVNQWRILFIIGAIPPLLGLIIRSKLPETPRWLIAKNKTKEAEKAAEEAGISKEEIQTYENYNENPIKLLKPYIISITIPLFLIMFLNIPPSGMLELTPLILTTLKISKADSLLFTSAAWVTPVIIGNVVAFKLIDRLGRFKMLAIGSIGLAIALFSMYAFSSLLFNIYMILFSMVAGGILQSFFIPIIYSLSTELYPTNIRGLGQGISVSGIRLAGVIGTFGGSLLLSSFGTAGILVGYAVISLLASIIIIFWLGNKIETSGKTLEEINRKFLKREKY
ncbi:MFS transporter [Acidianus manzaensis]|uniref:Major facilitator superfamily (MFS) profile domain-containing protein n=1 Tax=Acidianus manzaensis TaxID=282676 RepID=A0A1W6K2T0_9CREN|nr:MFS transporter [Acidianus manzaensis]ARM76829.1 hypothetical protein B6F84_12905 [Acidianus manzaensis]